MDIEDVELSIDQEIDWLIYDYLTNTEEVRKEGIKLNDLVQKIAVIFMCPTSDFRQYSAFQEEIAAQIINQVKEKEVRLFYNIDGNPFQKDIQKDIMNVARHPSLWPSMIALTIYND